MTLDEYTQKISKQCDLILERINEIKESMLDEQERIIAEIKAQEVNNC